MTAKKGRQKHPAVAFYWDVIHNIWHDIFLDPKHVVQLFDLMSFLNFLRSYDFPIKVDYSLAVILKKGNESAQLFEYPYSIKNYDVK